MQDNFLAQNLYLLKIENKENSLLDLKRCGWSSETFSQFIKNKKKLGYYFCS